MIDPASFTNRQLRGGFVIIAVEFTEAPLRDALDREALAMTRVRGREFHITLRSGLSQEEISVSLYHEVLEAATVASISPPKRVQECAEGDFERAARDAHAQWGPASPETLDRLLQFYDFPAEYGHG